MPGRMSSTIKTLIVDDHPIFLRGVRAMLEKSPRIEIVGEANDGASAWQLIQSLDPDVVVLDLDLPNMDGLQVARRVHRHKLRCRIVVLTMHKNEDLFRQALEEGVLGYLVKDDMAADVAQCLRTVHSGAHFIAPALSGFLLRGKPGGTQARAADESSLSPTQRAVLNLLAGGLTSKEIGQELGISHRTVENHRFRITETLGLKGQNALLRYALQQRAASGAVEPPLRP